MDRLLQRLKYAHALALADWAAEELAAHVASRGAGDVDALVPLPLAPARQRERGFNQAQEIARRVARRLGVPASTVLARTRETAPQAGLRWDARAANVRNAFACTATVRGRRFAVIDDVMTTGATLREAAQALLAGGASSVAAWAVARTLPPAGASAPGGEGEYRSAQREGRQ